MLDEEQKQDDRILETIIANKEVTIVDIDSDELMSYICHYLKSKGESAIKKKMSKPKPNAVQPTKLRKSRTPI